MHKILFLFIFLFSLPSVKAQIQGKFDGQNDFAHLDDHSSFNFSANEDFTTEFMVQHHVNGEVQTLLSKHNEDEGWLFGINEDRVPFMLLNGNYYYAEVSLNAYKGTCYHIVFNRQGNQLSIVVNNDWMLVGYNADALGSTADLTLGNSPSTTEGYFYGQMDECRIWNTFIDDQTLSNNRYACLRGNESNLLALWSIEEAQGNFFNDLTNNHFHFRLGSSNQVDVANPLYVSGQCQTSCCPVQTLFTVQTATPTVNQPVSFINQSMNAVYSNWYVDGILVSSQMNLTQNFTSPGTYTITLEAGIKSCKRRYSQVIDVRPEDIYFCGEYSSTYQPTGTSDQWIYDRFGNKYLAEDLSIPDLSTVATPSRGALRNPTPSLSANCDCQSEFGINTGVFQLYFEDCILNTNSGFDDATAGSTRRQTICQVYADLSAKFTQTTANCIVQEKVNVRVMPSSATNYYADGSTLSPLPSTVGGAASAYSMMGLADGIFEVMPWLVLNSGAGQQFSGSNLYHGFLRINFTSLTTPWHETQTLPVPATALDLYSVALHESLHMMGMGSFIIKNGTSYQSRISNNPTGGYGRWDQLMQRVTGSLDIIEESTTVPYAWTFNTALTLPTDLENSCTGTDLRVGPNAQAPLYTGATYNAGSSLSHLDESCTGATYVMHPSMNPGQDKRSISSTEEQLLNDMGYAVAGYTNCTVVGVDDIYGNCSTSFAVDACNGSTLTISVADLLSNDLNATSITDVELIGNLGSLVASGADYIFTPATNAYGDYIFRYKPIGCSGQEGNTTYGIVQVTPCKQCSFDDIPIAQQTNPFILDNGPDCGTGTNGKCVDCGFNKNPHNLVCNPEFCADDKDLINVGTGDYFHMDCGNPQQTQLPGWYRAVATPGYHAATAPSAGVSKVPVPMHGNSGFLHLWYSATHYESVYTEVGLQPNKRHFLSVYGNAYVAGGGTDIKLRVTMLESSIQPDQLFSCQSSANSIPFFTGTIALDWNLPERTSGNNTDPFLREGSTFVTNATHTGYLFFAQNNYGSGDLYLDQVELVEDDFTAGDDQTLVCNQALNLGGTDFGMLSDVRVEYTWTNQTTLQIEAQYWVERELSGNFLIYDMLAGQFVTQIPTISVMPAQSTTYRLSRSFVPDTDGTLGGITPSQFNGAPLFDDVVVTVPNAPVATANFTHVVNCNTVTFTSDASTLGASFTHSWDVDGDGAIDYTTANPVHSYAQNGTYTVTHYVNNGCGVYQATQQVVIVDNALSLQVQPSTLGPLTAGANLTVDVIVTNNGTTTLTDIFLALPQGIYSTGLNYTYPTTNIGNLNAGQSTTITVPVTVAGSCIDAQICAEITSVNGTCSLPLVCSPLIDLSNFPALNQQVQVTTSLTSTFMAPHVTGGLVEFEVQVQNLSASTLSNIDVLLSTQGLTQLSGNIPSFSLSGNAVQTFTVQAKVLDCAQFGLTATVTDADNTCPASTTVESTALGVVTPFELDVILADTVICAAGTGLTGVLKIFNPSSQTLSNVNLQLGAASSLLTNISAQNPTVTLAPNAYTTINFTYDGGGIDGQEQICADILSIGTSVAQIPFNCAISACDMVHIYNNPVTINITPSNTTNPLCANSLPSNEYFIVTFTNNTHFPLDNMPVSTITNGINAYGSNLPTTLSLAANQTTNWYTVFFNFAPTGPTADFTVELNTLLGGCSIATNTHSYTIWQTYSGAIQVNASYNNSIFPGPYTLGSRVVVDFTFENITNYTLNNIAWYVSSSGLHGVGLTSTPNFNLAPGATQTFTVTGTVTDCNYIMMLAAVQGIDNVCQGGAPMDIITYNPQDLTVDIPSGSSICPGQTSSVPVQINNPSGQQLIVDLSASGASTGSIFSSVSTNSPVALAPGMNTVNLDLTNAGTVGTENVCMQINQVNNIPYTCGANSDCEDVIVEEALEINSYTMPMNITSVCPNQYVNVVFWVRNNTGASMNNIALTANLTGANVLVNPTIPATVNLGPGASVSYTYVTQIPSTGTGINFTASATSSTVPSGCPSTVTTDIILPLGSADPSFTFTDNCGQYSFSSSVAAQDPIFAHSWDIDNDGIVDYTTANPVHSYPGPGTYTVQHSVTGSCGTQTSTQTITISPTGSVAFPIEVEGVLATTPDYGMAIKKTPTNLLMMGQLFGNTNVPLAGTLDPANGCAYIASYSDICGLDWLTQLPVCGVLTFNNILSFDIEYNANNEVYALLNFTGSFTHAGTTYTSNGGVDYAIFKLDASGNIVWIKTEGGAGDDYAHDIELNGTDIYLTGRLNGTTGTASLAGTVQNYVNVGSPYGLDYTPGIGFSAKYSDVGASCTGTWSTTIPSYVIPTRLTVSSAGELYLAAVSYDAFTFAGSTHGANTSMDVFVLKYNANGTEAWGTQLSSGLMNVERNDNQSVEDVVINSSGELYAHYLDGLASEVGPKLAKLDATTGAIQWNNSLSAGATFYSPFDQQSYNGIFGIPKGLTLNASGQPVVMGYAQAAPAGTTNRMVATLNIGGQSVLSTNFWNTYTATFDNTGVITQAVVNNAIVGNPNDGDAAHDFIYMDMCSDATGNIYQSFILDDVATFGTASLFGDANDAYVVRLNSGGVYAKPQVGGISASSTEHTVLRTKSIETVSTSSFKLYPNPTTQIVTIELLVEEVATVILRDMTGRLVLQKNQESSSMQVDLGDLPAGMYTVECRAAGKVETKKLILLR